jgi:hypothetical protein
MNPMRIACLHTAESNFSEFDAALAVLGRPDVRLTHKLRADLLAAAEAAGALTPTIAAASTAALRFMAARADAVLLTCSTLGPVTEGTAVIRVDAALAETAAQGPGPVVVLCAAPTTLAPTRALFAAHGITDIRLLPGAWALFRAGDIPGYHEAIAEAARAALAAGAARVALAQASMAGAAALCQPGRVLTCPAAGLAEAIRAAATRQSMLETARA